jgi:polysaccharide biosynthesis/export protein
MFSLVLRLLVVAGSAGLAFGSWVSYAQVNRYGPPSSAAIQGTRYRLGPGDRIRMVVFKVPGYESLGEVISDGTISLPRVGSILVMGLTLDQARERIRAAYNRYLRQPIVFLDLVYARPMRITVTGEVQKPGLYSLDRAGNYQLESAGAVSDAPTMVQSSGWPTLVEAIQKAGGITARGDLTQVTLMRKNTYGQPKKITINYWEALRIGAPIDNPILYDGDVVVVATAETINHAQMIKISSSNLAPDTIGVNVIGEVTKPGIVRVRANSHLANAIQAAGGLNKQRANTGKINLYRLEPNGSVAATSVSYSPADPLGSLNNPALQEGDVVVVNRSGLAITNDTIRATLEPVGPVINAASLLRLLGM